MAKIDMTIHTSVFDVFARFRLFQIDSLCQRGFESILKGFERHSDKLQLWKQSLDEIVVPRTDRLLYGLTFLCF